MQGHYYIRRDNGIITIHCYQDFNSLISIQTEPFINYVDISLDLSVANILFSEKKKYADCLHFVGRTLY